MVLRLFLMLIVTDLNGLYYFQVLRLLPNQCIFSLKISISVYVHILVYRNRSITEQPYHHLAIMQSFCVPSASGMSNGSWVKLVCYQPCDLLQPYLAVFTCTQNQSFQPVIFWPANFSYICTYFELQCPKLLWQQGWARVLCCYGPLFLGSYCSIFPVTYVLEEPYNPQI